MSSIDKSVIKMGAAYEIGVRLDDVLESAEKAEARISGVPDWMRKAENAIMLLQADIDKECGDDRDQAAKLKSIVTRAQAKLISLTLQAENEHKMATGRITGLKIAVEVTKRLHDEEGAKMVRAQQEEAAAIAAGRAPGERPPTIKAQRLAEAQQTPLAQEARPEKAVKAKLKKSR